MQQTPELPWKVGSQVWQMGRIPRIMGIVNCTPDSFSDGGQYHQVDQAVEHGLKLVAEGADVLDIGGESTRPGAEIVSVEAEKARVVEVIRQLAAETSVPISIDTTKSAVARAAIEAGALIVNDISGLTFDEQMPAICRETDVAVIAMHIQGTPQTMQAAPHYEDCPKEVQQWLEQRLNALMEFGLKPERLAIDPGIGFGKTALNNVELLRATSQLRSLGRPVLIGHSRKRFLGKLVERDVDERLFATVGVSVAAAQLGADLIRVHDVAATKDAITTFLAIHDESLTAEL